MTELISKYFEAFNNKDLVTLSELYTDNVILNEWHENIFTGKEAVLAANKTLFDKFNSVVIEVLSSGVDEISNISASYISLNEISVSLDDDTHITVVDIIEVVDNKIRGVMAYRGF
jgi:ketosteroid isomerase-like protein